MTTQQKLSKALINLTSPIPEDMAYHVYLMEWANLNKN